MIVMILINIVHLQCFCVLFICNLITTNLWPAPAPLIAWHCKSQYLLHLTGQPNTVPSPCNMRPQITFPGHQVCSIKSVPSNLPLKQHLLLAHTICYNILLQDIIIGQRTWIGSYKFILWLFSISIV